MGGTLQTVLCYTRYDTVGVALFRLCCATLDVMLVCGILQTVLCYTYEAGRMAFSRLCCATLDMLLVCGTLQTLLRDTRYVAGVWHSPDRAVLL